MLMLTFSLVLLYIIVVYKNQVGIDSTTIILSRIFLLLTIHLFTLLLGKFYGEVVKITFLMKLTL